MSVTAPLSRFLHGGEAVAGARCAAGQQGMMCGCVRTRARATPAATKRWPCAAKPNRAFFSVSLAARVKLPLCVSESASRLCAGRDRGRGAPRRVVVRGCVGSRLSQSNSKLTVCLSTCLVRAPAVPPPPRVPARRARGVAHCGFSRRPKYPEYPRPVALGYGHTAFFRAARLHNHLRLSAKENS